MYKPKYENMRIVRNEGVQNLSDCSHRVFLLGREGRVGKRA